MKEVAIIGGGYTGLTCAKKLINDEFNVTIYESTGELGGMAKCIETNGSKLEKHYRHIFKSDKFVIDLLKEFDLFEDMQWNETKMAYYSEEGLYEFGTPISLLKYKPLSFIEKIKFGLGIIRIKLIKNYHSIEKYSAEEWIKKHCGEISYKKIWEPLLITKFGKNKDQVSMSWLWGKINLRSSSSTSKGERLGYLTGSFERLTKELEKYLLNNRCAIKKNCKVEKVLKDNDRFLVKTNQEEKTYDYVISTVSYEKSKEILENLLSSDEKEKMTKLKYTSAKTLLIFSKKSWTPFYWINIGDTNIPFGGVIEHTNMIDNKEYDKNHIIYISNYMDKSDRLYKLNAEELLNEYMIHLKKIYKDLDKEDIIKVLCFEEEDAQPIITQNYSNKILNINLDESGIYMANMAQIYPEDRGMNYAIKMGYEVAEMLIKDKECKK